MKIEDIRVGMKLRVSDRNVPGFGEEFEVKEIRANRNKIDGNQVWGARTGEDRTNVFYHASHLEPIDDGISDVVAWEFSLAKAKFLDGSGYTDFGPVQISREMPQVPEGSIRGLRALVYKDGQGIPEVKAEPIPQRASAAAIASLSSSVLVSDDEVRAISRMVIDELKSYGHLIGSPSADAAIHNVVKRYRNIS